MCKHAKPETEKYSMHAKRSNRLIVYVNRVKMQIEDGQGGDLLHTPIISDRSTFIETGFRPFTTYSNLTGY